MHMEGYISRPHILAISRSLLTPVAAYSSLTFLVSYNCQRNCYLCISEYILDLGLQVSAKTNALLA